jgi:DNA-binding transcriptional LysR family regulator
MDTLVSLRIFRHVAEGGSFSAAAARIGVSPAMASKHVAHLERQLRARLFNRSSRHVSLTEAGTLFYDNCRDALDSLDGAAAALSDGHQEPRGNLKVTAPVWCATGSFGALLASYRERHPQVVLDLRLSNEKVDLARGGFDLALRVTNEPSPALIVRPICPVPFQAVATPGLLARSRADASGIAALDVILPSYLPSSDGFPAASHGKERRTHVRVNPVMKSDNTNLTHRCALAGLGAALLPRWLVADDLEAGRLVAVPGTPTVAVTLHAAYTSRMYLTPKVRSFIDFLAAALGGPAGPAPALVHYHGGEGAAASPPGRGFA